MSYLMMDFICDYWPFFWINPRYHPLIVRVFRWFDYQVLALTRCAMIKHATYTVSLANHYKNGKILWALSNCCLQPIFSEFRPENMGVIWAARSCFHVYWKNKSIVFVGSCHQLQSRRKLSFGLQEDLKIYLFRPICTWSKSGARMEHHISVDL